MEATYYKLCETSSDINQHLPVLRLLASLSSSVVECGVRSVVSSYAFAVGLGGRGPLTMVDIEKSTNVEKFLQQNPNARFILGSDLECPLVETDLLFIDTWHVYGHLRRELARWHSSVRKFIALHDTTVDGEYGETIRNKWNPYKQSRQTGIPVEEITRGLRPAVQEFLAEHPEWTLLAEYTNNNGLTILARSPAQE